jgi:hypothetical protein
MFHQSDFGDYTLEQTTLEYKEIILGHKSVWAEDPLAHDSMTQLGLGSS